MAFAGQLTSPRFATKRRSWLAENGDSVNPDIEIINAVRPGLATTRGPLIDASSTVRQNRCSGILSVRHFGAGGAPDILVAQGASH